MKITTKTTKEQIITALGMNASAVKKVGGELYDRMAYTDKMLKKDPSKVKRADLVSLLKDVINTLGNSFKEPALQPVAENSVKKPLGKKTAEKTAETEDSGNEAEPKKATKTKVAKKTATKKSGATVLNSEEEVTEQAVLLADTFTDTLEVKDDDGAVITYEIAHDIKTMEDLMKSMEKGDIVVFAMYWTKRHLKQFPYFNGQFKAPKEFPLDLDLATCLYASDNGTCAYVMSMYTEGMYVIFPENLDEVNGVRFSNGIEFQIYRQVEA